MNVNDTITAGLDSAEVQKSLLQRQMMKGLILSILGIIIAAFCLYIHWKGMVIHLNGADGPTSVFIAGKIGKSHTAASGLIGCGVLAAGVITIIRARKDV